MRKVSILVLVALGLTISGCGNSIPLDTTVTKATGNWEAQLSGGAGPASQVNFVTEFTVTNTTGASAQPLDIVGFHFFNQGACFSNEVNATTEVGSATLNASSTGAVTGSMTYTVTSNIGSGEAAGSVLTLTTGPTGFTGTTNGIGGTIGTLSNGVVQGTWTLTGTCTNGLTPPVSGTFLMCQGAATCTPP